MELSQYNAFKDKGLFGIGQPGIAEGLDRTLDLSLSSYLTQTGRMGNANDPDYQAWAMARVPGEYIQDLQTDRGTGVERILPNGNYYIPDSHLASNMDDGWGEGFGVLGKFASLVGLGGLANGAWGGLGQSLGLGDAPWGVNPTGLETAGTNPFAYTPEFQYGNLSGINPGDFTSSMLPGGANSLYGAATGLVDLGGVGGVTGLGGVESLFGPLAQKIGEQAARTVLGRVINGTATTEDYASIAGKLGATALGILGANNQSNQLGGLAARYDAFGAPSRARYEAAMTPGFDPMTIPGYAGALDTANKSLLAQLSASGGNPFGNPGGLIDAQKKVVAGTALPALQNYTSQNAAVGFGAPMAASLNLQTQGIGADANALNALGYGLNALTNPQPSYMDLIKQLRDGFKLNEGTGLT